MRIGATFVIKNKGGSEIAQLDPLDMHDYWNVLDGYIQEIYYPGKELWLRLFDMEHNEILDEFFIKKISVQAIFKKRKRGN